MKRLPNNLSQWLDYIESSHPSEIDLGLGRIRSVADRLQLAGQWDIPVITVAGTNGKGSTVAYLRALAEAHGRRVGCYTSPHFQRYNERVLINGMQVSDGDLCDAFAAVEQARAEVNLSLTYFEYGTLAALWLFRREPLDLVLLEVGLGGRLDAVNLVDPSVAIVTTVALDHQDWLGNDREAIGHEKVGIARSGRPLLYGEEDMPDSVARFADAIGAPLYHWGTDFGPQQAEGESWNWYGSDFDGQPLQFHHLPQPTLPFANAATALQAMILAGITPVEEAVREAIPRAQLTGRMQRVDYRGRELLLDVAHNPHAAAYLAERLPFSAGKTWAVVGMLADKDLQGTLHALQRRVDHWYLANLDCPRGASAQQLAAALGLPGLSGYESVASALTAAVAASQSGDRLLVVGSFYTVADALSVIQE